MTLQAFAEQLIFAIFVGALVGIEREHARKTASQAILPIFGVRTTILFSMVGFLVAFTSKMTENTDILTAGVILSIIIATTVYISNVWVNKHTGATTYMSMILVFFMGLFVGFGGYTNYLIAVSLSIITTLFLVAKRKLVGWTRKLTYEEIFSAIKFGIIAVIILPLLPNRFIDPWNLINPYEIWYIIVAVSAIYFVSYILLKELSHKGLLISSFFGGIVSSNATAYELSCWIRKKAELLSTAVTGLFIACIAGQIGNLIIIYVIFNNILLLKMVIIPYAVSIAALLFFTFLNHTKKHRKDSHDLKIKFPFAVTPALKFGGLYLLLVVAGGILNIVFGDWGALPTTIAGSLFSSTVVITSLSELSMNGTMTIFSAAQHVMISTAVSLLIKIFWVHHAKSKKCTKAVSIGVISTAALALLAFYLQFIFLKF